MPPGSYTVKASAIGFNSVSVQSVRVMIDLTTNQDFQLSDTSVQLGQEVVVIATKPLIQKDRTSTTAIVGDDLISELPVTEISDVLQLQAGVVVSGGSIHIRGGRSGQIAYQIDGVPVTDAYDGNTVVNVNTSAVQELQVISGAFNAEYGQALSGVVNLVTKDGNNNFNGSISTYAGDYISNNTDIYWNIQKINPVSIRNIEGSLSGPIIYDKLFFFTNLRYYYNTGYFFGRRDFLVTDRATEVPGSGGTDFNITGDEGRGSGDREYVSMNPNERFFGQGKISYNLMSGVRLSYNYILEKGNFKFYDHGTEIDPG